MAYNALNNLIDAYIYANGVQAITGQILNGVLKQMVSQLGSGYHLMGVAGPETVPASNDYAMAYFAATAGEYTDFGGITLAAGEVAVLLTYGNGSWSKQTIYNVPTGTADLENTADFITNAVTDLVNYYTKTEVDDTLANYPTLEALATALADYYTKQEIDTTLEGYPTKQDQETALGDYYTKDEMDAALGDRYTKDETDTKLADYYKKTETYDKDEVDSIIATLSRQEYVVAWDGASTPDVTEIPAGVTVTYSGTTYTGTLAASASTVNKIYMVWNGTAYDMYGTSQDGGYSWVPMGTTTVDLSQYATKAELSQLEAKVTDLVKEEDTVDVAASIIWTPGGCVAGRSGGQVPLGVIISSSSYSYSDYIPVNPGDVLTFTNIKRAVSISNVGSCFYDSSKNAIEGIPCILNASEDGYEEQIYTVPEGVYFVRFSKYSDSSLGDFEAVLSIKDGSLKTLEYEQGLAVFGGMVTSGKILIDQGSINNGGNISSNIRVRTASPIHKYDGYVSAPEDYVIISIYYYSSWTDETTYNYERFELVGSKKVKINTSSAYARVVFAKVSNGELEPSELIRAYYDISPSGGKEEGTGRRTDILGPRINNWYYGKLIRGDYNIEPIVYRLYDFAGWCYSEPVLLKQGDKVGIKSPGRIVSFLMKSNELGEFISPLIESSPTADTEAPTLYEYTMQEDAYVIVCYKYSVPGSWYAINGIVMEFSENYEKIQQELESSKIPNMISAGDIAFEQGTISGGANTANSERVRMTNAISTNEMDIMSLPSGFIITGIWYYSSWFDANNYEYSVFVSNNSNKVSINSDYNFFRIAAKNEQSSSIVPADIYKALGVMPNSAIFSGVRLDPKYNTDIIATARNYILKATTENNVNYFVFSDDSGKTWKTVENTIGDITFVHFFTNGNILLCGTKQCYTTSDFVTFQLSSVYDYDGSPFTGIDGVYSFYRLGWYNNEYHELDGKEVLIWNDYNTVAGYLSRVWFSDDFGETIHCILKDEETTDTGGNLINVRHFHRVCFDDITKALWVTSGDIGAECKLLKGIKSEGIWSWEVVGTPGSVYKLSQLMLRKPFACFVTDYTDNVTDTGLVICPINLLDLPQNFKYLYKTDNKEALSKYFEDECGNKILFGDGAITNAFWYARGNFDFKKIPVAFTTNTLSFGEIIGPNAIGQVILFYYPSGGYGNAGNKTLTGRTKVLLNEIMKDVGVNDFGSKSDII